MALGDLATLADVQAFLNLNSQGTFPPGDTALLQRMISAASSFIRGWTNRQALASGSYQEVRESTGAPMFLFAEYPVTAVAWVAVDGTQIPAAEPTILSGPSGSPAVPSSLASGYRFTPNKLVIQGYCVPRGALVAMQYTAGYQTIPADLAQACMELVALRYRERSRIGEASKHLPDGATVSYSQRDMSNATKTALSQYLRVAPVGGVATPV